MSCGQSGVIPVDHSYQTIHVILKLEKHFYTSLVDILLLPQRVLIRSRGGTKRRAIRSLSKQLSSVRTSQPLPLPLPKRDMDPKKAKVAKALFLAKQGHLSRATQTLFQNPLPQVDTDVLAALAKLHPSRDSKSQLPPLPQDAPRLRVDPDDLVKIIKKLANGAAPAASGWTGELLVALVEDSDCLAGIECLITDILNGDMSDEARTILTASVLIPTQKNTGGIRPIAISEAFYKLATLYALSLTRQDLADSVAPIQLALAPGGSETALHLLQTAITDPNSMAISVDIKNAFNTRNRAHILANVYNRPALNLLWRISHFSYGTPSQLLVMDRGHVIGTFQSQEGVRQGDVLGSALFALSMVEIFQASRENTVLPIAIMDDFYLVGSPPDVASAFNHFETALEKDTGLQINYSKTQVLLPEDATHDMRLEVKEQGLTICERGMPALGAVVGRDPDYCRLWLSEKSKTAHTLLFDSLRHRDMPAQHCLTFLRLCMLPRMNFWTRVFPPSVVAPTAGQFDQMVIDTATYKLQLSSLEGEAKKLFHLPIRLGGLGIRSMLQVSPIAYFSALAQASYTIIQSLPDMKLETSRSHDYMVQCHKSLMTDIKGDDKYVPKTAAKFWDFYGRRVTHAGLQRDITKLVEESRARKLLDGARGSKARYARLQCSRAKYAGSWLTTPLGNPLFRLANNQFSMAVRIRLGLPPQDNLPKKCTCGKFLAEDAHHFLGCSQRLKTTMTLRHDKILYLLARLARMGNVATQVEVPLEDMKRPDANFHLHTRTLSTDVSIIHPSAPTYFTAAARPLGAAETREKSKLKEYEEKARQEGMAFQPFVMETYGAFGKQASEILDELATEASQNGLYQIGGMKWSLFAIRALSVCLQWGNAMVLLKGCTLARKAVSRVVL